VNSSGGLVRGVVEDIGHDPARHAPLALVRLEDGTKVFILATEGMGVGDTIAWGEGAEVRNGNTLPLAEIPAGTFICNIEAQPNDGGKFVRSGGVQAVIVDRTEGRVGVTMPSGRRNGSAAAAVPRWESSPVAAAVRNPSSRQGRSTTR